MKRKILHLMILLSVGSAVLATSYSGPVKQTVYSQNGLFYAVIDPHKTMQEVYKKSEKKRIYWSFSFSPEMDSWFIPDNGEFAACIRWRFVRAEDLDKPAVIIFRRDGTRKDFSYNSIVKARRTGIFETAPKGSFWRVWYESLKIENNKVEIFTHDEKRIVISCDEGDLNIYRD